MIKKLFLILIILLQNGCLPSPRQEDVYKIAVVSPYSGPDAALGISIANGAELAVNEANLNGGINRKKIVLIKEDDGGLVGDGAFFAYRLTKTEMVLGVVGHLDSDISIPASEFYTRAMIAQISPGTTSPYFTDRDLSRGYVFRTIGRDDEQGKVAADYVLKHGFKRVVVLFNERDYGRSLAGEFVKAIKTSPSINKPTIVFYNMIQEGLTDYGSLLSQVSSYKPDIVFQAGECLDAGYIIKDFNKYGLEKTQFIGGDGIYHSEFIKTGGINTEGALVVSAPPIRDKSFNEKYIKYFSEEPTGYSANSYDAANILIEAIRKVKEKDSEKIAKEIAKTNDFQGVTGLISFDSKGDLTSDGFVLNRVVNGKFKVVENE